MASTQAAQYKAAANEAHPFGDAEEEPQVDTSVQAKQPDRSRDARSGRSTKKPNKLTPRTVLHLARRVLIFAAAILYLDVCISACVDSTRVLRGRGNPPMEFVPYVALLMGKYAGTTTLRKSPLVLHVLNDDTTPREGTLYLESDTSTSFLTCTNVAALPDRVYTNEFQRSLFETLVVDTSEKIPLLHPDTTELIMPVVDCSSSSIAYQDLAGVRFFYLTRLKSDPDEVYLMTVVLSIQEYKIVARNENGAAGVATIAFIGNLQAQEVTHYFALALGYPFMQAAFEVYELEHVTTESFWQLNRKSTNPMDSPRQVLTASRSGFYISSETEQSNIKHTLWGFSQDPLQVITYWRWEGRPVLRDSWAWLHCLHLLLACDVLVNLSVLLVVVYHNLREGNLWMGDAFVAVSNTLWVRSSLVLLSWYMDEFWAVLEFCMHTGNAISGTQSLFIYPSIMRADLLALYFCVVGVIGNLLKERIDPALTIGLFYVGFEARMDITKWFPSLVNTVTASVKADYNLGMSEVDLQAADISPLRLWSTHSLSTRNASFVFAAIFPVFSTFAFVILYVMLRKLHRLFFPVKLVVQRITGFSEDEERLIQLKRNLTLFEIATGAALQNRYGVVADYDNCVYIKGMKFATADGIYSSGYVIANGKFLVQTDDLVSIFLMKISHTRFRSVYIYDVAGSTVKQQARLVYPETMSYRDLLRLNIGILS